MKEVKEAIKSCSLNMRLAKNTSQFYHWFRERKKLKAQLRQLPQPTN